MWWWFCFFFIQGMEEWVERLTVERDFVICDSTIYLWRQKNNRTKNSSDNISSIPTKDLLFLSRPSAMMWYCCTKTVFFFVSFVSVIFIFPLYKPWGIDQMQPDLANIELSKIKWFNNWNMRLFRNTCWMLISRSRSIIFKVFYCSFSVHMLVKNVGGCIFKRSGSLLSWHLFCGFRCFLSLKVPEWSSRIQRS